MSSGPQPGSRIVLVSNRLPISVISNAAGLEVRASAGGLATGLRGMHADGDGVWIGWPGSSLDLPPDQGEILAARCAEMRVVPVHLPEELGKRFYQDFSNGVLWPTLHYLIDRIPLHARDWEAYVHANERFAEVVAQHARAGDRIWIHDYQLMLLPAMVRRRVPSARIGFFLHVPFPSSEVFRILPWREQLLRGLLGADLIGFHTFEYARHFTTSLLRILGLEASIDHIAHQGRDVRIGVFPMGIDVKSFVDLSRSEDVKREMTTIRSAASERKILLGVDRLDYTKGLPRRMLALERLLEREPSWRGKLRFIQLAVPSREHVPEYQTFRKSVEELVGRINGAYGTLEDAPIHYLHQSVSPTQLVGMYRSADVMVVTPLRDGMNLVCKEFIASRDDVDGVLVLSELAGAASELGEAVLVNPYDVDRCAEALGRALTMPIEERQRRMEALRARVLSRSVHDWATSFVDALSKKTPGPTSIDLTADNEQIRQVAATMAAAPDLTLLLDYDGTLVPLVRRPEDAAPDRRLIELLTQLSALPHTKIHLVSGRIRADLDRWFGHLEIALHAEHGLWSRAPNTQWQQQIAIDTSWMASVRPILEEFASRAPGAHVEEKTAGLAWHYRGADPQLGALLAKEVRIHLVGLLAQHPASVLSGDKVIEVRLAEATKAIAVRAAMAETPNALIAAFGDDRTDEDMFVALGDGALSFALGREPSRARYRFDAPDELRRLLAEMLRLRSEAFPAKVEARG